jgi:hypothetical protein
LNPASFVALSVQARLIRLDETAIAVRFVGAAGVGVVAEAGLNTPSSRVSCTPDAVRVRSRRSGWYCHTTSHYAEGRDQRVVDAVEGPFHLNPSARRVVRPRHVDPKDGPPPPSGSSVHRGPGSRRRLRHASSRAATCPPRPPNRTSHPTRKRRRRARTWVAPDWSGVSRVLAQENGRHTGHAREAADVPQTSQNAPYRLAHSRR